MPAAAAPQPAPAAPSVPAPIAAQPKVVTPTVMAPAVEERAAFARPMQAPFPAPAAPAPAAAPAPVAPPPIAVARPIAPAQTVPPPAASVAPLPATPAVAAPARPPIGAGRDNLQRIGGINAELERLLNVQGITRYSQIAHWSKAEVERFDRLLGHPGRIQRENWIEQAQILAKGGDTAYSREHDRRTSEGVAREEAPRPARLADAIRGNDQRQPLEQRPRSSDLSSLRSVRSEAFRPSEAQGAAGGRPSDLKLIRGIGVLIEKKLNSMGITTFAQIANWSAADIERVSHVLDFKGRIERENWVEQARILAAGGQTELSSRASGEPDKR
jgi:predicted flap endonuclease-1-like 5' DNA nuclease